MSEVGRRLGPMPGGPASGSHLGPRRREGLPHDVELAADGLDPGRSVVQGPALMEEMKGTVSLDDVASALEPEE